MLARCLMVLCLWWAVAVLAEGAPPLIPRELLFGDPVRRYPGLSPG